MARRDLASEVTKMSVTQKLSIPGPILSRFYQEMSNGMLGFNHVLSIRHFLTPYSVNLMVHLSLIHI